MVAKRIKKTPGSFRNRVPSGRLRLQRAGGIGLEQRHAAMSDPAQAEVNETKDNKGFSGMCCHDGLHSREEGGGDSNRLDGDGFGSEDRFGLHGIWNAVSK